MRPHAPPRSERHAGPGAYRRVIAIREEPEGRDKSKLGHICARV